MQEPTFRDKRALQQLYSNILPKLGQHVHENLDQVIPLFENFTLECLLDTWTKDPANPEDEISIENGNVQQMGLRLRLESFNRAAAEPFDVTKDLLLKLEHESYVVKPDKNTIWLEKEYLQSWTQNDYESIASKWCDALVDEITVRLSG